MSPAASLFACNERDADSDLDYFRPRDEGVPAHLTKVICVHVVQTVPEIGWPSSKDRPLLAEIQDRFDAFLTVARKLEKQHDLAAYQLGFVIVRLRVGPQGSDIQIHHKTVGG